MSLTIGFFSLKSGVGCSAMATHVANFLASKEKVAFIEQVAKGEKPEYHRFKGNKNNDGTFILNNVHYYPAQKIKDEHKWPLEYEPIEVLIDEQIKVYDFGVVNFMYDFPRLNKLYLVCEASDDSIESIQSFYRDTRQRDLNFDVIIVGASRDTTNVFKDLLPQIASIIPVTDKKETRIDYMFAMKLQLFIRGTQNEVPEYQNSWEYDPVEFYDENEWNKYWHDKIQAEEETKAQKKRKKKKEAKVSKKQTEQEESKIIEVAKSTISSVQRQQILDANIFDKFLDYEPMPEPTLNTTLNTDIIIESVNSIPEPISKAKNSVTTESTSNRVISSRPVPNLEPTNELDEISKASESFEPENFDDDISGEYKEHIIYEHNENATGLLGDLIEGINRGGHFCCNVFIATKKAQLFVFSSIDTFFEKLDVLKQELKTSDNVYYSVLTFNDSDREPRIFTNDVNVGMNTYLQCLKALDDDLRTNRNFSDEHIKEHKELTVFDEIIYAA